MAILDSRLVEAFDTNTITSSLVLGGVTSLLYTTWLVISRLYLSPIAKFPGPKLAALTMWYQFYYDVYLKGQYTWEIERMHAKYGPIIRINPYELHIIDSDFYSTLYSSSGRRDRWDWAIKNFNIPRSTLGTVSHDTHRMRRAPMNPYFSKRSINKLEPLIKNVIEDLCARFRECQRTKQPLSLHHAFAALTIDVITEYCFGQSYDSTNKPDFDARWLDMTNGIAMGTHLMCHFNFLLRIVSSLPDWFAKRLSPEMANLISFQTDMREQVTAIKRSAEKGSSHLSRENIFWVLLNNPETPSSEKSIQRLQEEGQLFVGAGQITTAETLAITIYYLLTNKDKFQTLQDELVTAMPNPESLPSWTELEQLPYLSAVILEGLRMTVPVLHRLQRIAPDETLVYKQWKIPPGTPVSMSMLFVLRDKDIFPDPEKFIPERWLEEKDRRRLDPYQVAFGKGSRTCVGMQLAMSEMYLTFAAVLRRFGDVMELYETSEENVAIDVDWFNPYTNKGARRVQVMFK